MKTVTVLVPKSIPLPTLSVHFSVKYSPLPSKISFLEHLLQSSIFNRKNDINYSTFKANCI